MNRRQELKNLNWPIILYPENIHMEFFENQKISAEDQKQKIENEMKTVYKVISKELKSINDLVDRFVDEVTEKVIEAEINDLVDTACVLDETLSYVSSTVDEYFKKLFSTKSVDSAKFVEKEEKPVNFITEILSKISKKNVIQDESQNNSDSQTSLSESSDFLESSFEEIDGFTNTELSFEMIDVEMFQNKRETLKSWRDIDNDFLPDKFSAFDVENITIHTITTLDDSLKSEIKTTTKDYYMETLPSYKNAIDEENKFLGLEFADYALLLQDLDVFETVNDVSKHIEYAELCNNDDDDINKMFFPTHPGGGLVLTKRLLLSMEKEDMDSFPYSAFFQEDIEEEEVIEKRELAHFTPDLEDIDLEVDMTPVPYQDFIALNINRIINALDMFQELQGTNAENKKQIW